MTIGRMKPASVIEGTGDAAPSSDEVVNLALKQNQLLELIATGCALVETLDALLLAVERDLPELLCSVLLLDSDGVYLRHGSAPSLPSDYLRAIDGSAIGPRAGSCGTAAYRAEQVIVADVESDPLWDDYRGLAQTHGLRACWSTPIFGPSERVLGTFAMYFKRPGSPTRAHQRVIQMATHVAAIAITRDLREKAVHDSEERYRLLNLATNDAVWDWDVAKNTLWWNDGVQRLFGYPTAEVTNELAWWVDRVHPEDRARVHDSLQAAAAENVVSWTEDYRFLRKDGSYADVQDRGYVMRDTGGVPTRIIGLMQDITERKQAQLRIEHLAYHEPVTQLPNRAALQADIARAIERIAGSGRELSLLLMNLNYFRDINNTLGYQNGDRLLQEVATRLRGTIGGLGRVASLGGDEFALLLTELDDPCSVERAVNAIHDSLQQPIELAGIPIKVEATLGIARYPRDGATVDVLWQHADIALRTAKERNEAHLHYHPGFDHYDPTRLALMGELRSAIDGNQLLLHYQPKLDLRSGRTIGVEALVRWNHPVRGMIFPDTFIPLAERTGLINPLTTCVVVSALRQGVAWEQLGFPLDLAVNLSARNLHDPCFCAGLLGLVREVDFPLSRLTLEITETAIMADPGRAKAVLSELNEAGIHLSMDDFGIGQSSLTYLKDLPITKMKIDKSFVIGFEQPKNLAIVRSAIDMARNLGLQVTAEGIEEESTYLALRELGCDLGQGYFFSKPLPVDRLIPWLHESRWGCAGRPSRTPTV